MSDEEDPGRLTVYAAFAANLGIAVTKFIVAALTGSAALLAEGIHSSVDAANELLLLVGIHRSRRPPSASHPFGHGKELFFWGLVVAMVIFGGGGAVSIYEGIVRLISRSEPLHQHLGWKLAVLAVAFVFEAISFVIGVRAVERPKGLSLWRAVARSRDPAIYTVVAEDTAALAGITVAAVGVTLAHVLHAPWIDSASSIVIGAILCVVAVLLARQSRSLLVGQSAHPDLVASIRVAAGKVPGVAHVGCPLTMQLGPKEILVNLDVELEPGTTLERMGATLREIEGAIRQVHEGIGRVFVEMHQG